MWYNAPPEFAMFKRLLDILVAGTLGVLCAPLLCGVAVVILLTMGRPVLFRQVRPGRGGRLFTLVKFRTMTGACGPDGTPLPDAARLTPLGHFLRATSLDELPQLWNVLVGEMSLVGPRPLLPDYLPRYSARQARRHLVRPGITGWAQVNGRNALSWEARFELDVWYVEHQSLALDMRILWLTLCKVARREGIAQAGQATMTPFLGSTEAAVTPREAER